MNVEQSDSTSTPPRSYLARVAWRQLLTVALIMMVIALVGAFSASFAFFSSGPSHARIIPGPTATGAAYGVITVTCGALGKPPCPTPMPEWVALATDTPEGVLAAIHQTPLFMVTRNDGGDHADLSRLGTPVFVRVSLVPGWLSAPMPTDYYAVPILNAGGQATDVACAELNVAHTELRVGSIQSIQPAPNGVLTLRTADQAVAAVQAQRHTDVRATAHPYLTALPFDGSLLDQRRKIPLVGGEWITQPIWLVPAADGQDYVVGDDGHVYSLKELAVMMHA